MQLLFRKFSLLPVAGLAFLLCSAADGQVSSRARSMLKQAINESRTLTLAGNVRPEATPDNDRGPVAGDYRIQQMFLQLRRPVEQQQALDSFLQEVQDPTSPNFHQWLTASEFGENFGLAHSDVAKVTNWLGLHGFKVNKIYPNLVIDFSGTAAQVRQTFHTQLHHLAVNGQVHHANMSDPQIPIALEPLVVGIASLSDFMPSPSSHPVPNYAVGATSQLVVPPDLATIYNLNPAFASGLSGQGQTIVALEDSDLFSTGDWLVFRKVFGLARPYPNGNLVTIHPGPGTGESCIDPGVNGDDIEAILDAEWATAAAPNATIALASCANTFNFGGLIALQNLLTNGSPVPAVVSLGFGIAEASLGQANNAYVSSLFQMAAAEGVSVFVSAGDSGATFVDQGTITTAATNGIAVNGYASTPYNVAVGGTDFADTYLGTGANYWSSTNSPTYASALSYVPELPWNASCANELLANSKGFSTTYGLSGYCNNGGRLATLAGGGGPSGCATGVPPPTLVVGNTCAGYPKPAWQSIVGNPADGVRDVPDVSLFASTGTWGHYFVACYSDFAHGGAPCVGAPNTWSGFGGTSISAPIMAGIQALVNQKTGSSWGNPNPVYYSLAANEYGTSGSPACFSDGSSMASCIFHDVTLGSTDVDCTGTNNCFFGPSPGTYGVLSTSTSSYQPAFSATIGWDFATGIGTPNAWNLITNWPGIAGAQ